MGIEGAVPGDDYEVFLSFRGTDTRKGFTDVLYHFLVGNGIRTFIDDRALRKGQPIATSLPKAIRESKIWIAIFSKGYADSEWCLIELAEMVKCSNKTRQEILPIFYDVTPSDVKNQEGTFRDAFAKHEHEAKQSIETLENWRKALKHVAGLSGFERDKTANGKEGELAKEITTNVLEKLKKPDQSMPPYLVGMARHLEEMETLLNISDNEPRTVGIYGMCGIGKTTISKAVYNKFWKYYDCHCFLENIRSRRIQHFGVVELKQQLLREGLRWTNALTRDITNLDAHIRDGFSKKKVLIVLDDVEKVDDLVVKCAWLGPRSRIIVTTRNKLILRTVHCYETPEMDKEQSEELFRKYAFDSDNPPEELRDISEKVADIASGLPFSLVAIGKDFLRMSKPWWNETCEKLEKIPNEDVRKHLGVCYKELDNSQKHILLDTACFLIGVDQRIASHMWRARDLYPGNALDQLKGLFLVKIGDNNVLNMHRQMRDVGRDIVRLGCPDPTAKGSRLFYHDDAFTTLSRNLDRAKDEVLALCLDFQSAPGENDDERSLGDNSFKKLPRLCFLQLDSAELKGKTKAQLCDLNWLCWKVPSPKSRPINFNLKKLVVLDLSNSNITKDWAGWSLLEVAQNLKTLNLTSCNNLHHTPDLSAFRNLERLILEDCKSLIRVDPSQGTSKKCLGNLIYLNVRNCQKLETLSRVFGSLALEEILLDGTAIKELPMWSEACKKKLRVLSTISCKKLMKIDSIAHLQSLTHVTLNDTPITELPMWSEGCINKLQALSVSGCWTLRKIDSIAHLQFLTNVRLDGSPISELPLWSQGCKEKLQALSAIGCKKLVKIDSIAGLQSLTHVTLDYTPITDLPTWSEGCKEKLQELSVIGCEKLGKIDSISDLQALIHIALNDTPITKLPTWSEGCKEKLQVLRAIRCSKLMKIDSIADLQVLTHVELNDTPITELPMWSEGCKKKLQVLRVIGCKKLVKIDSIADLQVLTHVELNDTPITELPMWSEGCKKKLQVLRVTGCKKLVKIDSIADLQSLTDAAFDGTPISEPHLWSKGCKEKLRVLSIIGCTKMMKIDSIADVESLTNLTLNDTPITELPSWSEGCKKKLKKLSVVGCKKLVKIDSIADLQSLTILALNDTPITELPSWSEGCENKLQELSVIGCKKLVNIDSIADLQSLTILALNDTPITELPDWSEGCENKLKVLSVIGCNKLVKINSIADLQVLVHVALNDTPITELPMWSEGCKKKLQLLSATGCKKLVKIDSIADLQSLTDAAFDDTPISELPGSSGKLLKLKNLSLESCNQLKSLPDWIVSLIKSCSLSLTGCELLEGSQDSSNSPKLEVFNSSPQLVVSRVEVESDDHIIQAPMLRNMQCGDSMEEVHPYEGYEEAVQSGSY